MIKIYDVTGSAPVLLGEHKTYYPELGETSIIGVAYTKIESALHKVSIKCAHGSEVYNTYVADKYDPMPGATKFYGFYIFYRSSIYFGVSKWMYIRKDGIRWDKRNEVLTFTGYDTMGFLLQTDYMNGIEYQPEETVNIKDRITELLEDAVNSLPNAVSINIYQDSQEQTVNVSVLDYRLDVFDWGSSIFDNAYHYTSTNNGEGWAPWTSYSQNGYRRYVKNTRESLDRIKYEIIEYHYNMSLEWRGWADSDAEIGSYRLDFADWSNTKTLYYDNGVPDGTSATETGSSESYDVDFTVDSSPSDRGNQNAIDYAWQHYRGTSYVSGTHNPDGETRLGSYDFQTLNDVTGIYYDGIIVLGDVNLLASQTNRLDLLKALLTVSNSSIVGDSRIRIKNKYIIPGGTSGSYISVTKHKGLIDTSTIFDPVKVLDYDDIIDLEGISEGISNYYNYVYTRMKSSVKLSYRRKYHYDPEIEIGSFVSVPNVSNKIYYVYSKRENIKADDITIKMWEIA